MCGGFSVVTPAAANSLVAVTDQMHQGRATPMGCRRSQSSVSSEVETRCGAGVSAGTSLVWGPFYQLSLQEAHLEVTSVQDRSRRESPMGQSVLLVFQQQRFNLNSFHLQRKEI